MITPRTALPVALAAALLVAILGATARPAPSGAGGPMGTRLPAATGCTNPAHTGPPMTGGLEPAQLAAAYGVRPLWEAGSRGQGMRVALIEPGESMDWARFEAFDACWGPFTRPVEHVVGGGTPGSVGGEPNFDSYAVLAMAPELARLDLFESATNDHSAYPALLSAALDPANTGGQLVDAISLSFDDCEASWDPDDLRATDEVLARAAALGVKVFAAAGDAGSLGWYPDPGTGQPRCVHHPVAQEAPLGVELDVIFPATSPWVTAVGGTELWVDGQLHHHGVPAGGEVTDQVVWHEPAAGGTATWAGGGGLSRVFTVADAPWQRAVGLEGMHHRPDIAALAGAPTYFDGGIGTSGAAPAMAGAAVVLDQHLLARGAPRTGFLNPLLYELAAGPDAHRVLYDVTDGTNDVYGLGCCTAGPGYDLASGLGSIRFDGLAAVLLERAAPTTTTPATEPGRPAVPPRFTG